MDEIKQAEEVIQTGKFITEEELQLVDKFALLRPNDLAPIKKKCEAASTVFESSREIKQKSPGHRKKKIRAKLKSSTRCLSQSITYGKTSTVEKILVTSCHINYCELRNNVKRTFLQTI